jgi:DNA-binding IscR family transcriptional regulator
MRRDSRLSVALHALLHIEERGEPVTSEALGERMKTNPVVLRRTLAGLREAGIVSAAKGHGGGWVVARDLRTVTVGDVYTALGCANPFFIGPHDEEARCPLEQAVDRAVEGALSDAEALLLKRLQSIKVRSIIDEAWMRKKARHGHA